MRHPLFLMYGMLVLLTAGYGSWAGWNLFSPRGRVISPRSVRDNPGAYRPIYSTYRRYSGGK